MNDPVTPGTEAHLRPMNQSKSGLAQEIKRQCCKNTANDDAWRPGLGACHTGKAGLCQLCTSSARHGAGALLSVWPGCCFLSRWSGWASVRAWHEQDVSTPHTAVVEIKGEIASGAEASAELIVSSMRTAFEDEGAQAVVLLINSPGGSPVQAGIINDEISRLKAKHNKPVYAVVEESAASAAYYIAVAADKIFVDKASIVGSIGVLMDGFGFTGLMDKLGVERRLMTAGENKGFLDPFSPQTEKQREFAQAMLNQIHQQFIAVVKAGRGQAPEGNAGDLQRPVLERPAGH